ncbi:MAG TPA: Rid family hydrolase [Thermoleophilaceae bacterium]|nr:Rid family hydrolase [Thermoleophilaceae bacterium]
MPDRVPARNEWGDRIGYSRAVRAGNLIEVAGTTAPGDSAYEQARAALAAIEAALQELGASLADVIRTRMFVVDIEANADEVGRAHGEVFGEIKPASAMYGVTGLLRPEMLVEIEATART